MVDPNETPEDVRKREAFMSFRAGWKHGAGARARDKRFEEHSREDIAMEYQRGYQAGFDAMGLAGMRAAERLGYDARMSLLRSLPPIDPPAGDVVELVRCGEKLASNPKVRCSLITDGHGPDHKRITPTGRVTHKWPVLHVGTGDPR